MTDRTDPVDHHLRRAAVQTLESLARAGVTHLPPASLEPLATQAAPEESPPRHESPTRDRASELRVLSDEVAACTRCGELAATRTQTVFGVGNPAARLCFFGEAPGADEDRQGEPFVGAAGKLLTKIIENGLGMQRGDVYIFNVLKCRPPGNRNPTSDESDNCSEYYERQLQIIQPEFVCCLGTVAAQTLLETTQTIGRLRGEFHDYRGSKVLCTYHPAYLLRNPAAKKQVWQDMKLLLREMGLPVPGEG